MLPEGRPLVASTTPICFLALSATLSRLLVIVVARVAVTEVVVVLVGSQPAFAFGDGE